jgi:hypothetical protein
MLESHEEVARMRPIMAFQGNAEIINNHPSDPLGTAWLAHQILGKGSGPDIVHVLVFANRSDLFLFQAAKPDAVLSGDIHGSLHGLRRSTPQPDPLGLSAVSFF